MPPQLASADYVAPEPKSRNTAFAYSAVGSAASLGVLVQGVRSDDPTLAVAGLVGALILPSAGEIYAGKPLTWGMGIRIAAVAAALVSVADVRGYSLVDPPKLQVLALLDQNALGTISALAFASGIFYDLASAGAADDDDNQRLHVHVTPTVIPTASSGPAVGLGIGGSF